MTYSNVVRATNEASTHSIPRDMCIYSQRSMLLRMTTCKLLLFYELEATTGPLGRQLGRLLRALHCRGRR